MRYRAQMNPKVALLLAFITGLAAGGVGMYFAICRPHAAPVPSVPADLAAKEIAEAVREKNSHAPNWWDMDAPTPELPPVPEPVATQQVRPAASPSAIAQPRSPGENWRNMSPDERMQQVASFWSNQMAAARANFSNPLMQT